MDPISALGFACNVLDLIQLAIKTGSIMKEIYDSSDGLQKKHDNLLEESKTLETVVDELEKVRLKISAQAQSPLDTRMQEIAQDCVATNAAIQIVLDKCKAEHKSFLSVAKSVFKLLLNREDLRKLQAELDQRYKTLTSLTATKTLVEIDKLKTQLHRATQRMETQLNDSKEKQTLILEKIDILDDSLTDVAKSEPMLGQLKEILDAITIASDTMKVAKILENLRFPSMDERFQTVRDSAPDTFNWIFDEPDILLQKQPDLAISFPEWLRSGSGIFHIQGKPGSGKSSLMKFICEHERRDQLLREWAGTTRTLICSQFFFWRLGSAEERSFGGLIRGLLSGVIQHDPSLAQKLFPSNWDTNYKQSFSLTRPLKLTDKELSAAFNIIIHDKFLIENYRICFFIDGLDEFDESLGYTYFGLTQMLKQWSHNSSNQVKFCVSSRELPVFVKMFDKEQRITIQIFTEGDITNLVKQRLEDNEMFQKLRNTNPTQRDKLKQKIIADADGVFLWVIILLNQLENALINEGSIAKLEAIVASAPVELDAFFKHILDTIPHLDRPKAYTLLALAMRMTGMLLSEKSREMRFESYEEIISSDSQHITAMSFSFLPETLDRAGLRKITKTIPASVKLDDEAFYARIKRANTQVAAHCQGLLEYREGNKTERLSPVFRFTHRSIPEFLQRTFSSDHDIYDLDDQLIGEILAWTVLANMKFSLFLPVESPQVDKASGYSGDEPIETPDQELGEGSGGESHGDMKEDEKEEIASRVPLKRGDNEQPAKESIVEVSTSMERSNLPSSEPSTPSSNNKLNEELEEIKKWDNPLLRSDECLDVILHLVSCLRQTRFQDPEMTCHLLNLIDTELLQYRFKVATLDEIPDKARENFGRFMDDSDNTDVENATCLSIAAFLGLTEYWTWYVKKLTGNCDHQWYLLNIVHSISAGLYESDYPCYSLYPEIFETFLRAGRYVDSIVSSGPNQKWTIWQLFLVFVFFSKSRDHEYSPRLNELMPSAWETIEIWLKYGADPRLTFSRKLGDLESEPDESRIPRNMIRRDSMPMDIPTCYVITAHDGTDILPTQTYSKDRIVPVGIAKSFRTLFNFSGGSFTLSDFVKFENPPNIKELLHYINRNIEEREAQTNERAIQGQSNDHRDLASAQLQTEAHKNLEPSDEAALKSDAKISTTPAILANIFPHEIASFTRPLVLFSVLLIGALAYALAHLFSQSSL